jgi:integrase
VSTLYKPRVINYRMPDGAFRLPDGARVTKDTAGAIREVTESPCWYGRWTDANGKPHQKRLSPSKETARRMLAKLAGDAQLASVGILDRYAEQREKALADHLDDFRRALLAKSDGEKYARRTLASVRGTFERVGVGDFATLELLEPDAVLDAVMAARPAPVLPEVPIPLEWLTKADLAAACGVNPLSVGRMLKRAGLEGTGKGNGRARRWPRETALALQERHGKPAGPAAINRHLAAVKALTRWLVRNRRLAADPLAGLALLDEKADVRLERRPLAPEELRLLLAAAEGGRVLRGLTGPERRLLYLVASATGFRASELASLTPASLGLDGDPPTVTVRAAYAKNRKTATLPLRADVAAALRAFVKGRKRAAPLWPGKWAEAGAELLRADLAAAGIPPEDEDGRSLDLHGLRHTFITGLAKAGVHPRTAQELARHSDIRLTMRTYTHLQVRDLADALAKTAPPEQAVQGACKAPKAANAS